MMSPKTAPTQWEVWRPTVTTAQISRQEQRRHIACSDIGHVFDARNQLKPLESLPPEIACTVLFVRHRRRADGSEEVEIRMRNKLAALTRLAVDMGLVPGAGGRRAR